MDQKSKEYLLARLILKLANTIIKNRDNHLKALDLTTGQADSLQFFFTHENATITDLKKHLSITHQTARGIVQRLEAKELLSMQKSDQDGRYQIITLTTQGIKMCQCFQKNGIRTGHKLLIGMSEEEQELFFQLLQKAYKNVEND